MIEKEEQRPTQMNVFKVSVGFTFSTGRKEENIKAV